MAGQYSIRNAERKDVDDILRLANGLVESEIVKREDRFNIKVTAADLAEDISTWYHCLLLDYRASDDAAPEVVGYALWCYDYSTISGRMATLSDIFVSSDHRGNGCGLSLMQNIAKIVHDKGCKALQWNVFGWNDLAKKLYKKVNAENLTETMDSQTMYLYKKDLVTLAQETPKIGSI